MLAQDDVLAAPDAGAAKAGRGQSGRFLRRPDHLQPDRYFEGSAGLAEGRPSSDADIAARVQAERVHMLLTSPGAVLLNPVNAAILAYVLWDDYPAPVLVAWVALIGVVVAVRLLDLRHYRAQHATGRLTSNWGARFTVGSAVSGCLWSLASSVMLVSPNPAHHTIVSLMLAGLAAGSMTRCASYLPPFLAFSGTAIAPQIILYMARGDRSGIAMGLMLAVFAAMIVATGRRVTAWLGETLRLRIEQTVLVGALEAANAELGRLARFDPLTGLVNRAEFVETLRRVCAGARRHRGCFAVLCLDLDQFKDVNDTLGHPAGDRLLQEVAERLRRSTRECDLVARFGGDEFAILAGDLDDATEAGALAGRVRDAIEEPFLIDGNRIHSGASVGIAVAEPGGIDPEALLTHADVALYRAKAEGRHTYRFCTEAMNAEVQAQVRLAGELRQALSDREFHLVYQPQVEIETGRIVAVEAFLRWHGARGPIPPREFIPAAERSGVIVELGRWAMAEACRQGREWLDLSTGPLVVAVNISACQFKAGRKLEQDIDAALAASGFAPHLLELELTETALMEVSMEYSDLLARLRAKGVRIALDDFGTGYSSLLYLRRFPVDRIKIAQEFVADLATDPGDAAIVVAAIDLARALGLDVLAEGVETVAQLQSLKAWGCREVQGFHFAPPMPAADISALLRAGRILRPTCGARVIGGSRA